MARWEGAGPGGRTRQVLGQELEFLGQKKQPRSGLEHRSHEIFGEAIYSRIFPHWWSSWGKPGVLWGRHGLSHRRLRTWWGREPGRLLGIPGANLQRTWSLAIAGGRAAPFLSIVIWFDCSEAALLCSNTLRSAQRTWVFCWPLWCDGRLSDSIRGGTGQGGTATAVQGTGRPYGPGRDISRHRAQQVLIWVPSLTYRFIQGHFVQRCLPY